MHVHDAQLRQYLDRECADAETRAIDTHLAGCPACLARRDSVAALASATGAKLEALAPGTVDAPAQAGRSLEAFEARMRARDERPAARLSFLLRPAWIGAAAVLALVIAMGFPPVRAWTGRFLGLFRIERIETVQLDPAQLQRFQLDSYRMGPRIDRLFAETGTITGGGAPVRVASIGEASTEAGFPARLPSALEGDPKITVNPATSISFRVDAGRMQEILDELGRTDVRIPAEIDGSSVRIDIPKCVTAAYGDCERRGSTSCTVLAQFPSPVLTAPPGLDAQRVGEAVLALYGMNEEQARAHAAKVDWTTTLVLPAPMRPGSATVMVDGVEGTILPTRQGTDAFVLYWVREGIVHMLLGHGDSEKAVAIASSLG